MKLLLDAARGLAGRKKVLTAIALFLASAIAVPAQTLTTLHNFDGADGRYPVGPLVLYKGNFYGTTYEGGNSSNSGTVFKITPSGTLTTLYDFCSQTECTDGSAPSPLLTLGTDGNFYGTTGSGGAHSGGTFFRITPAGTLAVVYSFCSTMGCTDGQYPSQPIQATNGNFYGTTIFGGANGRGTVFEITPAGALTTLYNFCSLSGCGDGSGAVSGVIQGKDGNLYGTAETGGTTNADCPSGCGTVFEMTPSGTLTTLHSFDYTDGAQLESGLVQGSNGEFYGATEGGGTGGSGTVFEITSGGSLTTLQNLDYHPDGAFPIGALIQGSNGNFYGTTDGGGNSSNGGTVFEITPGGELATLYDFCSQSSCTDGVEPVGALVRYTNGAFIGATSHGGTSSACSGGCGTIFKLVPASPKISADCNIANSQSGLPPYPGSCGITNEGPGEAYGVRVSSVTISAGGCTYKAPTENLTPGQSVSFPISCTFAPVCNEAYTLQIKGNFVGGNFSGTNTFLFCTDETSVSGTN